ncbi:autotransporter assembly complex protein TamA [Neptunomonas antarctica]|uniref:Translocation and assembly module subunit TamA n=1 Tax=Neptunomonas antarctica TaxID=619304 RepID=A0A1N7PBC3_9GAMM|nr:autotransporter assembly complex family protein [Neptunomonas antarctica]SIT07933.1 autotransporter secretion outer membrane protein TamA [Neptunomonas antarctica]
MFAQCFTSLVLISFALNLMAATLAVEITGVSKEQEQNIRAMLSLESLKGKEVVSRSRLRYLNAKAEDEIGKALQPFGYYRPEITAELTENAEKWVAQYHIVPGPLLPIGVLDIKLSGDALRDDVFNQALSASSLRTGRPLVHSDYENLKKQLRSLAAERGYYQGAFSEHRVEVDLLTYQANIVLHYDSGPRFKVGKVRFTESPLSDDFLIRYVPFKAGDPVQSSALLNLQSALVDSDYFQRVEVRPLWDQIDGTEVPIEVAVDAHKQTKYSGGFGYGTDTGARTKLGITRRWINKSGHQFNTQLLASEIRTNLTAEYAIPGLRPQQDRYTVNLSLDEEQSDSVDTSSNSLGVSWQQQQGRWQRVTSLTFQQEEFTISDETQQTDFLMPRISYTTVSTKDRLNIRNGYRLTLQALGGSDMLLSDTNFIQLSVNAKAVHSLNEKFRLLGRVDAGVTLIDDFDKLPVSQRFFAGGDNSVRGYEYQSLSPIDSDGDVTGAQNLLVGSLELDYRLKGNWGIATFIDAGNAFDDIDADLYIGVGVGVRWYSPIGPVRIDLAVPQTGDTDGVRLHFSLGPDL